MILNINTDAHATDSLIDSETLQRIPNNIILVKGDQIFVEVNLYNKVGEAPDFLSQPDLQLTLNIGKISTRELYTRAIQRTHLFGTFTFLLDLARAEVLEADGKVSLEVSLETAVQSEVLLQTDIQLRESFITSPLLPSYPTNISALTI